MAGYGTATLDFGAFPGASDTSVAVSGQTTIQNTSLVEAWLYPSDTTDHTAGEHLAVLGALQVAAASIVSGTGFTIYGTYRAQPAPDVVLANYREFEYSNSAVQGTTLEDTQAYWNRGNSYNVLGDCPRCYGTWSVAYAWR